MDQRQRELIRLQIGERQGRADGLQVVLANAQDHVKLTRAMAENTGKPEMLEHAERDMKAIEADIAACLKAVAELNAQLDADGW